MKILMIPTWYPTEWDSTAGIYHKQQAEALAERPDVQMYVLFLEQNPLSNPVDFLKRQKRCIEVDHGVTVYRVRNLNREKLGEAVVARYYEKKLKKEYRRFEKQFGRPDVIHAQVTFPVGYAAVRLGEETGIPVTITEHASYFPFFLKGASEPFAREALQKADHCFAVSRATASEVETLGGRDCEVLPNLVDCSAYERPATPREGEEGLRLIYISKLRQQKRVDVLLHAIAGLKKDGRMNDITLKIVGDGFYMQQYERIAAELGLEKEVRFLGVKNRAEIAGLFTQSDALVISSPKETFGIPGVEALAAGKPVLSTRCGGTDDYIDDTCGLFCKPNDPADMADAIVELRRRLPFYDPAVLKAVAARYDKRTICDRLITVFQQITDSK
ncbi:MAG: glycosyltransferase family 4 protein [Clostridiales bacterium]|nr:glycosyltransferase family 4 protein [Clostridiales bacterium]